MKYIPLSKKRKKLLLKDIAALFHSEEEAWDFLKQTEMFELIDKSQNVRYLLDANQKVIFFWHETTWLPSLHLLMKKQLNVHSAWVDEGAVRFILNGADIFGQGIVRKDEDIKEDDLVVVRNPQNTPIALGKSLVSAPEMVKGRVIKNLHHVGDKIHAFSR